MILDIILAILLVIACIKGYQRGLIVAVFSLVAIIIGLAAAMKLSTAVAKYIGNTVSVSEKWLPFISFLVVFIVVVLLIRVGANLLQKAVETILLGFANRLGGILLYAIIFITVYSIFLFYAVQINFIKTETLQASATYSFIQPWGPKAINIFGSIIPWFKDMFAELEQFFDGMSKTI